MKNNSNLSFGSKEKYFLSDIYSQGELIAHRIKSKLILNDFKYVEPILFLYPSKEEKNKIIKYFELEIKGYFEYVGGEKAGEVYIPKCFLIRAGCTEFASTWEECVIEAVPDEIYQKHYLKKQEEVVREKTQIVFTLTENKIVRPWGLIEKSFKGTVKPDLKPRVVLTFSDNWIARFEEHYRYTDKNIEEVKGTFSASRLVLTLEKNDYQLSSTDEAIQISGLLDTLLWYLSFGSRQRTTWNEWTAEIGTEYVEYYRSVSTPLKINEHKESLVDENSIQEFLQKCIEYENRVNNLDLYLPIIYLVGTNEHSKTVEMKFLSLFMALEALLDLYAESQNKNKIIADDTKWNTFYAYMKKSIEDFTDLDNKDDMLKKLGLFNQPSRKVIYNDFCENIEVDNSDLWPVYGNNRDLSRIRNKLIHGKRFETWPILAIAKEHLRWTVERCLLAVLEWKEKTEVFHKESLQKYTAYHNWKDYYEKECSL